MKDELFDELMDSVREAGKVFRGEIEPSRAFVAEEPDVVAIREAYGLSQSGFASMLGISVRQNWEQGRRKPQGAARILLQVASRHPEAVLDVVHEKAS